MNCRIAAIEPCKDCKYSCLLNKCLIERYKDHMNKYGDVDFKPYLYDQLIKFHNPYLFKAVEYYYPHYYEWVSKLIILK